jgi:hypothetical protein
MLFYETRSINKCCLVDDAIRFVSLHQEHNSNKNEEVTYSSLTEQEESTTNQVI